MHRTLTNLVGGQPVSGSVRDRILSSYHGAVSTSGRCCQYTTAPRQQQHSKPKRTSCCAAAKTSKGGGQGFKGFGEPPKLQQKPQRELTFERDSEEEEQLLGPAAAAAAQENGEEELPLEPAYQMYTDGGYKARRQVGPVSIQRPEGEAYPLLCTTAPVPPGDLMVVSPALAFVTGGFQEVPELEDLHAALLEDGPSPAQRRVLDVLESLRPGPQEPPASAAAESQSPASTVPSLSTLDVKFWSGRGRDTSAPQFSSQRLMRLLSRAATAEDSQDPAAMQARHQKPVGYVALWPELAIMAHSCVPNTSQLVVADRLLLHAIDELTPGTPLTRNMIGSAITAPLSYRQTAVEEAIVEMGIMVRGQPPAWAAAEQQEGSGLLTACRCPRCRVEASASEELRDTLEDAYRWYVDEASETWARANESEDVSILRGLLQDCEAIIEEVEQAVQNEPGLDDQQQDWMRASVYDVYDLHVMLDELVNQEKSDPDYLRGCVELIRVHSPGSDSHVMVSLKHESMRQQRLDVFAEMLQRDRAGGRGVSKTDRRKLKALTDALGLATEFRIEAVIQRYGYVTEEIMGQLSDGLEAYMDGLEQLSVMKAQGMTELTREMELENGLRVQIVDKLEVSEESRVGPSGRGGATRVLNQDGMQVMVVNDGPQEAVAARRPAGGADWGGVGEVLDLAGFEEDGGPIIDLEVDEDEVELDLDAAVQAALDKALAAENAKWEGDGGEAAVGSGRSRAATK